MTELAQFRPPVTRRLWFVVTLTCLLITFPVSLLILVTGPVFRWRETGWTKISSTAKGVYAGALGLWLFALIAKAVLIPSSVKEGWEASRDPNRPAPAASAAQEPPSKAAEATSEDGIALCNAPETVETVKSIIKENAGNQLQRVQVVDFGQVEERWYEADRKRRGCKAKADLNTGPTTVTYIIRLGPSGKQIVQADIGEVADQTLEVEASLMAEYKRQQQTGATPNLNDHLEVDPSRAEAAQSSQAEKN